MGENRLLVIVRGKERNALKRPEVMRAIEAFQRHMERSSDVGGTYSIVDMLTNIHMTFHEGDPKWKTIPETWVDVGQFLYLFLAGSSPGDLDQFIDPEAQHANIAVFYRDYKGDTIRSAIARAKGYIEEHPIEDVEYCLAGGIIGVLAAINEEVIYSEKWSVAAIFLIVFILCALSFRSIFAALILILPLALSNLLASAFMAWKEIPLNINTLPVASLGVGIGVDYGIYLLSRIKEEQGRMGNLEASVSEAILTTGKAILFTATTLISGVIFWYFFSSLRFQAEMGLLVALLMAFNMFGALFLIPLMVNLFKPSFLTSSGSLKGAP
jgi:predicted RND superfamily exporter protein